MKFQTSNPAGVYAPPKNYSQAARVPGGSEMLFVSGQGPQNAQGETVGLGDMAAQAEQEEQAPVLRPRAHRETLLLLSLILAY